VTSTRAILVSEEQRYAADQWAVLLGRNGWTVSESLLDEIAAAYDNAGDQPRIQGCLEHGNVVLSGGCPARKYMIAQPCRVVTAIIVPLEEDA
jgi:hypothetical protein